MSERGALKAFLHTDQAIGETRRLLLDERGRAFRLHLQSHFSAHQRSRLGDIHMGRVTAREPGGGGVFVDIGVGRDALLRAQEPEGGFLAVRVSIEAQSEKGPVVARASIPKDRQLHTPGLIAHTEADPFLHGVELVEANDGYQSRELIDAAIDEITSAESRLPGGGRISLFPTPAFLAVDVDAAAVIAKGSRDHLAMQVNLEAVDEIARQVSLGAWGGIIVIDLLKVKDRTVHGQIEASFQSALEKYHGRRCEVGRISKLGLLESSVARGYQPIIQVLKNRSLEEVAALGILTEIERLGVDDRGAKLHVDISSVLGKWLEESVFDWKSALTRKIGPRFTLQVNSDIPLGAEKVRRVT